MTDAIAAAAAGRLPDWAEADAERRAHMERVAALLDRWAEHLDLSGEDRVRWRAVGWLHDALRDADPGALRPLVPADLRDLPDSLLHGPATAARLEADGVEDGPLLFAVAYHTMGHPDLDRLGRHLYLADFLEPGRTFEAEWRAGLRRRMPQEADAVLYEVVRARLRHLVGRGGRIRPETLRFWNAMAPSP